MVYLVVYIGELYGIYYKASHLKYNIFSSKRKAKKYINSEVNHLPRDEREQEKHIKEYLGIKNKKWRPEYNEKYYYASKTGKIDFHFFKDDAIDNFLLFGNNCFKTKEEAEFRLEQIKVYNELKNFADENNEEIDWNKDDKFKYYIFYHHIEKELRISAYFSLQYMGNIYFSSEELAKQAMAKVGADRIKKYLFGVE